MRSLLRVACVVTAVALSSTPTSGADTFKRLAVMPFENTTGEKALDWVGGGIAEMLTTDLGKFQDFTLVERRRLNDALKEIKLGQSAAVDPTTAQKMGKILGADAIVVGSFQRFREDMRIVARVIDVETAQVRTTARVDGAYANLMGLQSDIAAKLVEAMKGSIAEADKKKLAALPSKSVEAVQALSDGAYFLRNDLTQDALKEFDRAIALDANFTEAHYYKGVALARLMQWDDAIASLKRTLPRATSEQRIKWSWDAPFDPQGSQRGLFLGIDQTGLSSVVDPTPEESVQAQKRFAYTERSGKNTVFHFVDLASRGSTRVEIPDDSIPIGIGAVPATDRLTIIPVTTPASSQAGSIGLYGISVSGGLQWHTDLKSGPGRRPPDFDIWGQTLFEFYADEGRVVARDVSANLQQKWERKGLVIEGPTFRQKGDLLLATSTSDHKIHGIRASDGQDAWTADYAASSSYQRVTERALVVFEPARRVFAIELATGRTFAEVPLPPLMNSLTPTAFFVPSQILDDVVYFVSSANELVALDVAPATPPARQIRWKTPLTAQVRSLRAHGPFLYGAATTGELFIVDRASGAIKVSRKVADAGLSIASVGDDVVLAVTSGTLQAFEPRTGAKLWESPNVTPSPANFKGVVLLRPSLQQLAIVEATTGTVVWQYAGAPFGCWVVDDSVFVLESNGVREYALERSAAPGLTSKEAMTELASVLVAKGDLDEAARFADRVAREADPNYPPLRRVQAQLKRARGDARGAARELVTYLDLVGRQSKAGQEVLAELKARDGLLWQTETGGPLTSSQLVDGKLLGVGGDQLAMFDAGSGKLLWRQTVERLMNIAPDAPSKRLFYVHGENNDARAQHIYAIGIDGTGRKELVRKNAASDVGTVRLAYANNRLYLGTLSVDRRAGRATLNISAYSATTGDRLWEKTHDYGPEEIAQIRVPFGLFYPRGELLVYSSGRNMWVLRQEDGAVHDERREEADIASKWASRDSTTFEPDLTAYVVGTNEVVTYRLSSKQQLFRMKIPAEDPAFRTSADVIQGTAFFSLDGVSILAFDFTPGLDAAKRVKWRVAPPPGQMFTGLVLRGTTLFATLANAGVTLVQRSYLLLDPVTGKTLSDFQPLWPPTTFTVDEGRVYAFTPEGLAYAMAMK